ncbi:MAG: MFS transporter [Ktedonobacterales bacterium]
MESIEKVHVTRQTRFGVLWYNADFLKLWGGETVSLFGSQVTTLALPLTAILVLHATVFQVGILNAVGFAPFLFVTVYAGVWVDRRRRRPILIAANLGRAVLLGGIPVLALMGRLQIGYLFIIWFLVGIGTVFFQLAYQSFLPSLVPARHLAEGNSKLSASESVAEIGGPGLAGVLLQVVIAPVALLVDALSFLVSAVSLVRIKTPEPIHAASATQRNLWREIAEGFRMTFGDPRLRAFAGEAATYNLFWQIIATLFVLYAVRDLHMTPVLIGAVIAAGSAGGLLGALVTNWLAQRAGVGRIIVGGSLLSSVAPLAFPLARDGQAGSIALLLAAFFLSGCGVTAYNVHAVSLRQAITPAHLLGRMNASYRTITYGVIPIGALLGGLLGQTLGLRTALVLGAVGLTLSWIWLAFSPVMRMQTIA